MDKLILDGHIWKPGSVQEIVKEQYMAGYPKQILRVRLEDGTERVLSTLCVKDAVVM